MNELEASLLDRYDRVSWAYLDRKGRCSAYVTTPGGHFVVGVVGEPNDEYSLVAWHTASGIREYCYKLPFGVLHLAALPDTAATHSGEIQAYIMMTTVHANKHFIICLQSGQMTELELSFDNNQQPLLNWNKSWHLCNNNVHSDSSASNGDYAQLRLYWEESQPCSSKVEGTYTGPSSSACIVLDKISVECNSSDSFVDGCCCIYFPVHTDLLHPEFASQLVEVSVSPTCIDSTDSAEVNLSNRFCFKIRRSISLDLPCRVQGMGLRGRILYIIGDNRHIIQLDLQSPRLVRVTSVTLKSSTPLPRYIDYSNAAVFIIHKPVGCLSSAADYESAPRGTVYEWAGKAGFPVNMGLVGRLDGDTSGIMVFTNDGLLNERILRPAVDASEIEEDEVVLGLNAVVLGGVEGGAIVQDNQCSSSTLTAQVPAQTSAVSALPPAPVATMGTATTSNGDIVDPKYKSKEYILTLLQGRNKYCLDEHNVLNTTRFEEEFGRPLVFSRCHNEHTVREAQIEVIRRYQEPILNKHNRSDMGWVIEVRVTIQEGKHKQIRRLAKRAGYHVVSLCRTGICGDLLRLETVPQPGQCRWLSAEEKRAVYKAFHLC